VYALLTVVLALGWRARGEEGQRAAGTRLCCVPLTAWAPSPEVPSRPQSECWPRVHQRRWAHKGAAPGMPQAYPGPPLRPLLLLRSPSLVPLAAAGAHAPSPAHTRPWRLTVGRLQLSPATGLGWGRGELIRHPNLPLLFLIQSLPVSSPSEALPRSRLHCTPRCYWGVR